MGTRKIIAGKLMLGFTQKSVFKIQLMGYNKNHVFINHVWLIFFETVN